MTKQQYLSYKKYNQVKILYEYYKEKFDHKKHSLFLNESEFFTYIQMSSNVSEAFIKVCNYYDSIFKVITIMDNEGNIISTS